MSENIHYVNNQWLSGGTETIVSLNPATNQPVWTGLAADKDFVDQAVEAACQALPAWSNLDLEKRIGYLKAYEEALRSIQNEMVETISKENGKPLWEAKTEVQAMLGKIDLTIKAYQDRTNHHVNQSSNTTQALRYKPHGIIGIIGPFNLPGHITHGQIIPALLAGNTVVFKPSELAPLVGQKLIELWEQVGLPAGVLNMVQGGGETGKALCQHSNLNGLFFTGSFKVGVELNKAFASDPGKILALEMGGNNPLVVHQAVDLDAAAYLVMQSAFITSGQRCTCARRLIVPEGKEGDLLIDHVVNWTKKIQVGPYTQDPEPFMGPVVTSQVAQRLLEAQASLQDRGGKSIIEMSPILEHGSFLSPGLIDVTEICDRQDEEIFGPLLQIVRVKNYDTAIEEANNTSYGLSAGLISNNASLYNEFRQRVNAGLVNWNRQITGASGALPFGGIGQSGNHRPCGYFTVDLCCYPVGSIEQDGLSLPEKLTPGMDG